MAPAIPNTAAFSTKTALFHQMVMPSLAHKASAPAVATADTDAIAEAL
jgi:hypothetical protein